MKEMMRWGSWNAGMGFTYSVSSSGWHIRISAQYAKLNHWLEEAEKRKHSFCQLFISSIHFPPSWLGGNVLYSYLYSFHFQNRRERKML
ncbi:unnamed protein product [Linum tenue]|uniref:Uncharacterized protein n=1 Tax=Linum tenue TaxID=586396 RepID=A0AAV0LFF5_9ROSI|nr:unnamed protein product [Linum tenue]